MTEHCFYLPWYGFVCMLLLFLVKIAKSPETFMHQGFRALPSLVEHRRLELLTPTLPEIRPIDYQELSITKKPRFIKGFRFS